MKLRIEKMVYGGDGLARISAAEGKDGGKTVFVSGTLPGELVEARIRNDRGSFASGDVEGILEASPRRIPPGCEYVPRCGGCQMQHAEPALQLEMKVAILKETLSRAHLPAPGEIGGLHGPPWAYRNRIRLHATQRGLAYRRRGSHQLLPVTHCPIAAPLLEQAIAVIGRMEAALLSLCEEVELFTNSEESRLLVSLWPSQATLRQRPRLREQALEKFAAQLQGELPVLSGVGLLGQNEIMHWGERSLTYTVSGHPYQVSLGGFFQVNRFLLGELLRLVIEDGSGQTRSGRQAWDLYSGAGLFARALDFEHVTAVEAEGVSAGDLQQNLSGKAHRIVCTSTLEFLRGAAHADTETSGRPELIVVDPPRAGLGKEICSLLGTIAAPTLIYISCDPATMARDLQSLLQFQYSVEAMHLVDLFPQTFHMETVTFMKRI